MNPKYAFQYCQKLVLFSEDWQKIFLAQRAGEADYDNTYSFIAGKMETSDKSILAGLKREVHEEIGNAVKIRIYPEATHNILYLRKDGYSMILPHYIGHYLGGEIKLNSSEYSQYKWVSVDEIKDFDPKVNSIPEVLDWALELQKIIPNDKFVEL